MTLKNFINKSMTAIANKKGVIVDMGGGERFQKWMQPYQSLFVDLDYRSFDYDNSTNPDIVGDIHNIPLADNSIESIICSSVLEHIENPIKAVQEMYRVLKPEGLLFIYVPSIYPYHARKGHYPDYWRLFDDTLTLLLKDFSQVEIQKRGGYFLALSFFVPKQNKLRVMLDLVANLLDSLWPSNSTTAGYYVLARK